MQVFPTKEKPWEIGISIKTSISVNNYNCSSTINHLNSQELTQRVFSVLLLYQVDLETQTETMAGFG